ncbi:MlaD family protein [Pseudonocardia sp. NPDC049154]|uniref:MlaD family protein n=1 Tax=Pseudonocardia sp. NPDC049154 TaxID=3155501 RepID=UPI003401BC36
MSGPTTRSPRRSRRLGASRLAAVAAAVVAVATIGASSPDGGEGDQVRVLARFADASPLLAGNDVRLAGVKVGEIAGMRVVDGAAQVVMDLDRSVLPLHIDSRATIRPVTLLGERFVDLDRGSAAAPVMDPAQEIPVDRTGQATDLDQVLDVVDDPTGEALGALVGVLGDGLDGNGRNVDDAIKALEPAMTRTDELAGVLADQNDTLNRLVDSLEPVASSLATQDGKALDGLVGSAHGLLGTAAANQQDLRATLQELPGTIGSARTTLGELAGTAREAAPTLAALRPTTDNLQQVSRELIAFAESADPALASLQPVLDEAKGMLDEVRPVATSLREQGPDTVDTVTGLEPVVRDLTANRGNVMEFLKRWALTTNAKDGLTHYFRAFADVTPMTVTSNVPGEGGNAGLGGTPPPLTTDPAGEPVEPPQTGNPDGLLTPPAQGGDGGVTGLTKDQEGGALGFLIGGDS